MICLIKIFSSTIIILLITEIAKRNTGLAGYIASMPINIIIALLFIRFENSSNIIINQFIGSAIKGIIPLIFFLSIMYVCQKKNISFEISCFLSLMFLSLSIFMQNRIVS